MIVLVDSDFLFVNFAYSTSHQTPRKTPFRVVREVSLPVQVLAYVFAIFLDLPQGSGIVECLGLTVFPRCLPSIFASSLFFKSLAKTEPKLRSVFLLLCSSPLPKTPRENKPREINPRANYYISSRRRDVPHLHPPRPPAHQHARNSLSNQHSTPEPKSNPAHHHQQYFDFQPGQGGQGNHRLERHPRHPRRPQ